MKLSPIMRGGWSRWHLALALALVTLGVLATLDTWLEILQIASTTRRESSQILLVPLVAAWLVWMRRGRLRLCQPRGSILGPLMVATGWAARSLGFHYSIESVWHGSAVLIVVGCLISVMGRDFLVHFFPAFVALLFLVPIPGRVRLAVAVPLQQATAVVTQNIFDVMGIAVERSGNALFINDQPVRIAEECNGMRMVFTLVLVAYTFAFITPLRPFVRFVIIAASPILAILCNVIRLVPTVWVYGHYGPDAGLVFHDVSSWAMVGVAFLLLLGIIRALQWAMVPVTRYSLAHD